ncbi:RluA family pseudouridine synthase [Thalassotalea marina]|uniref:Pseudouridine synthase RsuA/RluA-like domain-containing protein n=1 Tax=Thalassotalea marina TaxID=1673741 RepID=A0A919BJJ7_9GAMM|nr:RluA family pseudouridine synthase [Thalassotalea marina]GHF96295.1 hypothetical protein GCM10017161_25810 [Thalassotalea marina]
MTKFELHIPITTQQQSLVEVLLAASQPHAQLSVGQIKSAINKGALWLSRGKSTTRLRKVKKPLQLNDTLHFYFDQKVLEQQVEPAIVIADYTEYSVLYKPFGMLSQGSKWSDHCTITRWAEQHTVPQRPAFLVHRLDRAASGLIMIAHSKKAAKALSQMFEQRQLSKTYHIICHGHYQLKGHTETQYVDQKPALSHFSALAYHQEANLSLVEVKIETGRKHQIRIHAAHQGFPVVGDRLHGKGDCQSEVNLQLCAVKLSFSCPITTQEKVVELPTALRPNLEQIGNSITLNC